MPSDEYFPVPDCQLKDEWMKKYRNILEEINTAFSSSSSSQRSSVMTNSSLLKSSSQPDRDSTISSSSISASASSVPHSTTSSIVPTKRKLQTSSTTSSSLKTPITTATTSTSLSSVKNDKTSLVSTSSTPSEKFPESSSKRKTIKLTIKSSSAASKKSLTERTPIICKSSTSSKEVNDSSGETTPLVKKLKLESSKTNTLTTPGSNSTNATEGLKSVSVVGAVDGAAADGVMSTDLKNLDFLVTSDALEDIDDTFLEKTFQEMQSTETEQIKNYLLSADYGNISNKKKNEWKKKKVEYLLNNNLIRVDRLKKDINILSMEKQKDGFGKKLRGKVTDIVYDAEQRLRWVIHFSQTGVVNHHRYCDENTLDDIFEGMNCDILKISATPIKKYDDEFRGQENAEPVELFIQKTDSVKESTASKATISSYCYTVSSSTMTQLFVEDRKQDTNFQSPKNKCLSCGSIIRVHAKDISSKAKEYFPTNLLASLSNKIQNTCSKCICNYVQSLKYFEKHEQLMHCLNSVVVQSKYKWGDVKKCEFGKCIQKYITEPSRSLLEDKVYLDFSNQQISYREIDLRNQEWILNRVDKSKKSLEDSLVGASFFGTDDLTEYTKHSVEVPTNVDVGIIYLPDGDFILLSKSNFDPQDAVLFAIEETKKIKELSLQGRSGSAGGIVTTETNSHSMTKYTSSNTNVFIPSNNGTSIGCIYENKDKQEKCFKSIYNDVFMSRMNILDKIQGVVSDPSFRNICLKEMLTRTTCLVLACELDLLTFEEIKKSFDFLNKKDFRWHHEIETGRHLESITYSKFELLLLQQVCTTGEMRNHQALKLHVDGNKSHLLETLTLFGRVDDCILESKTPQSIISSMEKGYLFLPMCGMVVGMECCTQTIHCKLKKTLHIPDLSRNKYNWSKVHGPCGYWAVNEGEGNQEYGKCDHQSWFEEAISALVLL